jgi:NADH-quinone oxidoreductase subunit J
MDTQMEINLILLACLLLASLWTVMTIRLVRAVVGLAITSAILSIIMFRLNSPLSAVFELSVCAGLISVIFVTTVSFTQRLTQVRLLERKRERLAKFWLLPFIIVIVAALLVKYTKPADFAALPSIQNEDVRYILWNKRHLDLLGQIAALLVAAVGVVVLFKERKNEP